MIAPSGWRKITRELEDSDKKMTTKFVSSKKAVLQVVVEHKNTIHKKHLTCS